MMVNKKPLTLFIGRSIYEEIIAHLKTVYPLEGCGLLAGNDGRIRSHYPIENRLHSLTAYDMAPAQLIAAFMDFEAAGERLLAIYHSHPNGPSAPSLTDMAQNNYPEAAHIIVSLGEPDDPVVRAFWIEDGRYSLIPIEIIP